MDELVKAEEIARFFTWASVPLFQRKLGVTYKEGQLLINLLVEKGVLKTDGSKYAYLVKERP